MNVTLFELVQVKLRCIQRKDENFGKKCQKTEAWSSILRAQYHFGELRCLSCCCDGDVIDPLPTLVARPAKRRQRVETMKNLGCSSNIDFSRENLIPLVTLNKN